MNDDDPHKESCTGCPLCYADAIAERRAESSALAVQVGGNYYKQYPIQPAEFSEANRLTSAQANVLKYVMRHQDKGGAKDLRKAIHYCDLMLEVTESHGLDWRDLDVSGETRAVAIPLAKFLRMNRPVTEAAQREVIHNLCHKPGPAQVRTARLLMVAMINKHYPGDGE